MDQNERLPTESPRSEGNISPSHESRTVTSEALLQGETEIQITHRGDVYRLRVTRSGKLILNK